MHICNADPFCRILRNVNLLCQTAPPHGLPTSEASYFHEIRGQSPYTLNELKVRSRQSEERIVDLAGAWDPLCAL